MSVGPVIICHYDWRSVKQIQENPFFITVTFAPLFAIGDCAIGLPRILRFKLIGFLVEYNLCTVNIIKSDSFQPEPTKFFKLVTLDSVIEVILN